MEEKYPNKIPSSPGVYIFYKKDRPLYIGKATNLKARIRSHFNSAFSGDKNEQNIVANANKIKYYLTQSDFLALILEAELISRFQPAYNRRGRDDKSFLYLKVAVNELYPKVYPVRKTEINNQGLYFGPFPNQKVVLSLMRTLRKIFPFCSQKKIGRSACFYNKLGLCQPCPNLIVKIKDAKEKKRQTRLYNKNIKKIINILKGKINIVFNQLYRQLNSLIKKEDYEKALKLRNEIFLLQQLTSSKFNNLEEKINLNDFNQLSSLKSLLKPYFTNLKDLKRIEAIDISNFMGKKTTGSLVVFKNGMPEKSSYRRFKIKQEKVGSDFKFIEEILARRFKNNWPIPQLLVIDGGKPQILTTIKFLKKINKNIPVIGIAKRPDRLIIGVKNFPTIRLPLSNSGFNLIRLIRDEAHRFAKKYHLFLRRKDYHL